MSLNVWNKETCQNHVLLLTFFQPLLDLDVFPSQNFTFLPCIKRRFFDKNFGTCPTVTSLNLTTIAYLNSSIAPGLVSWIAFDSLPIFASESTWSTWWPRTQHLPVNYFSITIGVLFSFSNWSIKLSIVRFEKYRT